MCLTTACSRSLSEVFFMAKPKTLKLNRAMPKGVHGRRLKAHNTKVGEICWAWNSLHAAFCMLFVLLLDSKSQTTGKSIWNSLLSDSSQRDILLGLAVLKVKDQTHLSDIIWACEQAKKLSGFRNTFVHTAVLQNLNTASISAHSVSTAQKNADKLDAYKDENFQDLRGDIIQLEQFVSHLYGEMIGFPPRTWQQRPLSLVLQRQSEEDANRNRRKSGTKPKPPP